MDVGLNNRNTLGEIAPEFTDVVFLVEANSNEQFNLWQDWSDQSMTNIKSLPDYMLDTIKEDILLYKKLKALNDNVKHNKHKRVKWKQIMNGFGLTIGHIKKFPVFLSFSFAIINNKKICFYECTSRMSDSKMIEDFLIKRFQLTHDNYTRWNHTNAMNFHNCVNSLDRLDKEPRDTVYRK